MPTVHGHESRMMRAPIPFIDALQKRAKAEYKADGRGGVQILRRLAPLLNSIKLPKIDGTEAAMKPLAPRGFKYDEAGRIISKKGKKAASKKAAKKVASKPRPKAKAKKSKQAKAENKPAASNA